SAAIGPARSTGVEHRLLPGPSVSGHVAPEERRPGRLPVPRSSCTVATAGPPVRPTPPTPCGSCRAHAAAPGPTVLAARGVDRGDPSCPGPSARAVIALPRRTHRPDAPSPAGQVRTRRGAVAAIGIEPGCPVAAGARHARVE